MKGRVLHLRCFLEGIEVPIVSCSVSAAIGGPASAHIELLDSEKGFELLPRTIVHVFFYDDRDGQGGTSAPPDYTVSGKRTSTDYKLLFCGELFSVFHNKSGYGSRSMTIMCLDMSNVLDTSYIFQVSYSDARGILGTDFQAEAAFIAGTSIGNNPFDNILNEPQKVIQILANRSASSPVHARKQSKIGGLFAIFELLLGVEGHTMGMNLWTTVHERIVRLLDMIDSDDGETSKNLFDSTVFNAWLTNSVGSENPSQSYRQMAQLIMNYIYYNMVPIPTASYFKPQDSSGRESYAAVVTNNTIPANPDYKQYFFPGIPASGSGAYHQEWTESGNMDPEFLEKVTKVVQGMRDAGYNTTYITDGFRTEPESIEIYGWAWKGSPHSAGIAADISHLGNDDGFGDAKEFGSMFTLGNVAMSKKRKVSVSKEARDDYPDYFKSVDGEICTTDGQIVRFFLHTRPQGLNPSPEATDSPKWREIAVAFREALFSGGILNTFQFLNYMLVYPLFIDTYWKCPAVSRFWLPVYVSKGSKGILDVWSELFKEDKNFVSSCLMGDVPGTSLWIGMPMEDKANVWLTSWIETHKTILEKHVFTVTYTEPPPGGKGVNKESSSTSTFRHVKLGGVGDPAYYKYKVCTNADGSIVYAEDGEYSNGITVKQDRVNMSKLWTTYYTEKRKFWQKLHQEVLKQSDLKDGVANNVLGKSGSVLLPVLIGLAPDKGDDPVHVQRKTRGNWTVPSAVPGATTTQLEDLYDSRERMTGFLLRPDIWMCAPPRCNVIFPEDIISLNISRELMKQTSRVFLMTYNELYADNVIFNGHYFAPQFEGDIPNIQQKAFGSSTASEVIYPHEVYTGIVPKVSKITEVAFYARAKDVVERPPEVKASDLERIRNLSSERQLRELQSLGTSGITDLVRGYASNVAHYNLIKQRYSSNRLSINARFLPFVVPGLPAVVMGKKKAAAAVGFSSTHTWLGMIESVQHSYSQGGANTGLALSTCRPYKTGDESIDELLKLKKAGSNLFLNQSSDYIRRPLMGQQSNYDSLGFLEKVYIPDENGTYAQKIITKGFRKVDDSDWFEGQEFTQNQLEQLIAQVVDPDVPLPLLEPLRNVAGGRLPGNKYYWSHSTGVTYNNGTLVEKLLVEFAQGVITTDESLKPNTTYKRKVIAGGSEKYGTISTDTIIFDTFMRSNIGNTGVTAKFTALVFPLMQANLSNTAYGDDAFTGDGIRDISLEQADLIALEIQQYADSLDITIDVGGGEFKKISSVEPNLTGPRYTLGSIRYKWKNITKDNYAAVSLDNADFSYIYATNTEFVGDGATFKDRCQLRIFYFHNGDLEVTVPVLLPAAEYRLTLSDLTARQAQAAATATSSYNVPLEEALMPPWIDDAYKNGEISGASIKREGEGAGIGSLYRRWFGCDSIVDGLGYNSTSDFNTVTIEQAVASLETRYATLSDTVGKIKVPMNTYNYTKRNIATLTDMLAISYEAVTNEVLKEGGFHTRSVGNYTKLEALGIVGKPLKSSLTATASVTIEETVAGQANEGLAIDPRPERYKRVITYKKDVMKSRGKLG